MLKSLLIALDGSDGDDSLLELALRWSKRFDAVVIGLGVVEESDVVASGALLAARGHHHRAAPAAPSEHRVGRLLRHFARRCLAEGVSCRTLEDFGPPFVQILTEARRSDIVLLGRQAHHGPGYRDEADETLVQVLRESPRPVVAVPVTLGDGESIVVAYDGSLPASRALYAFVASGLGRSRAVRVLSVARDRGDAARHAGRALDFLRLHGIESTPHPMHTAAPAAEVILGEVRDLEAGLLVMGACGQQALREFFLGSVTRSVLEECPVPVFCYH